ncbi:AAA family ATPase, partial [Acidimicrobiaceae bacterium USS-CC1]|nr:AAA family ATPase [Acidiferrimicrobium australe]
MATEDLEAEQAYIDRAYGQLERMRRRAEGLLGSMKGADPDLEWALARRVRALADNPRALCFGRIDGRDGETWYVGRRHVEDEAADPVVVEWRAPVALPYYRA